MIRKLTAIPDNGNEQPPQDNPNNQPPQPQNHDKPMIYIKTIHRHNRKDRILTAVMNHRINLTKIHSHRQTTVICHMSRTAEIISHLILMNRQVRINQMILEEVRTIFHRNRMTEMFFYRHRVSHMETVKIQCHILTENNLKCRNKKFLHFFIKKFHITPKISI